MAEVYIMLFNAYKIILHYLFVDMLHQKHQMNADKIKYKATTKK